LVQDLSVLKLPGYNMLNSVRRLETFGVEKITAKSAIEAWCIKMDRVKKFLKGWGKNIKGHARKYKRILSEELEKLEKQEEEASLSADMLNRKYFIHAEMLRLTEEEESYWHKRSNSMWFLKGNSNTAFFHRIANGKKGKILSSLLIIMTKSLKGMLPWWSMLPNFIKTFLVLLPPLVSPWIKVVGIRQNWLLIRRMMNLKKLFQKKKLRRLSFLWRGIPLQALTIFL